MRVVDWDVGEGEGITYNESRPLVLPSIPLSGMDDIHFPEEINHSRKGIRGHLG